MSCDSSNLIYVIICPMCGEEYIGETGLNNKTLRLSQSIPATHKGSTLPSIKSRGSFKNLRL